MRGGRLKDKVAVITGGCSGIGAATARLFAREGAQVFVLDQADPGNARMTGMPGVEYLRVDVSREHEVRAGLDDLIGRAGRIDILYSGAGIGLRGLLHETSSDDWDRICSVNLRGVYLTCKYVLPHMMARAAGSILTVASGIGLVGSRSHHAYSASKGGLILLTRSVARAYARYGIRANCICPGPIDTPMLSEWTDPAEHGQAWSEVVATVPLGRLGRPEEVAYAALFLASDEASFVTGAVLAVDGGVLS